MQHTATHCNTHCISFCNTGDSKMPLDVDVAADFNACNKLQLAATHPSTQGAAGCPAL